MRIAAFLALAALIAGGPVWAQDIPPTTASLTIGGEVAAPLTLSVAELARIPHLKIEASEHGNSAHYAGVPLVELLKRAGAPLGETLRGKNVALVAVAIGADGYRAVFALAELDPAVADHQVLVVDEQDDKPLSAQHGPLRLVVPQDKRAARWVRQLIRIEVRTAP
jgi:DMSO/TMAO reductase YedYZ molybdopterin-dependent catalytic subunit